MSQIFVKIPGTGQSLLRNKDVTSSGSDPEYVDSADESRSLPPQTTYASCFGLPYQDHNYGAPPPITPPASPVSSKLNGLVSDPVDIENIGTNEVVTTTNLLPPVPDPYEFDYSAVDDSVTRCVCDFQHDDGYMICCDKCSVWQHVDCMGIERGSIPEDYLCEKCQPRKVDKHKARQLQIKKRELFNLDTSATDTEDETKQPGFQLNLKKKVTTAKRRKKKDVPPPKPVEKILPPKGNKKLKLKKDKPLLKEKKKEFQSKVKVVKEKPKVRGGKKTRGARDSRLASAPAEVTITRKDPKISQQESDHASGSYEETDANWYSPAVLEMVSSRKFNGQHKDSSKSHDKLQVQLCSVLEIGDDKKGLEALEDMTSSEAIIEYTGKVMLREQYDKENQFFETSHPHVLFYSQFEDHDLCIDANTYGNDARFVRRSCTPNAEVRHVVEGGKFRFYIYSTKGIVCGSEITIPFDFNYHECSYRVECACNKSSCPVVKFYKRDENVRTRKKRSSKSVDQRQSSVDESPEPKSPPAAPAKKKRKILKVSLPNNQQEEHSSPDKQEPRSRAAVSAPVSTIVSPTSEVCPGASGSGHESADPEDDAEIEKRKKLTREDRKMEAILRAFEKMEKREERRKEALARMETTKKPVKEEVKEEPIIEPVKEEPPEEVKEEPQEEVELKPEPLLPKPKTGGKNKKKKHGTPARRRSRMSSSASGGTSSATETILSPDESSQSNMCSGSTTPVPPTDVPATTTTTAAAAAATTTPMSNLVSKAFKFPKTKKHLMVEWLNEKSQDLQKPLTIQTVSPDATETTDFVKCVPSPHSSFSQHLRRNSFSGNSTPKVGPSVSQTSSNAIGSSHGSAKKRWLRQAMFEGQGPSGSMSPVANDTTSPLFNSCANSPGGSPPVDFVTPLKKRRLARSSMSTESPYPSAPSTPISVGLGSGEMFSPIDEEQDSHAQSIDVERDVKNVESIQPHSSPEAPDIQENQLPYASNKEERLVPPEEALMSPKVPSELKENPIVESKLWQADEDPSPEEECSVSCSVLHDGQERTLEAFKQVFEGQVSPRKHVLDRHYSPRKTVEDMENAMHNSIPHHEPFMEPCIRNSDAPCSSRDVSSGSDPDLSREDCKSEPSSNEVASVTQFTMSVRETEYGASNNALDSSFLSTSSECEVKDCEPSGSVASHSDGVILHSPEAEGGVSKEDLLGSGHVDTSEVVVPENAPVLQVSREATAQDMSSSISDSNHPSFDCASVDSTVLIDKVNHDNAVIEDSSCAVDSFSEARSRSTAVEGVRSRHASNTSTRSRHISGEVLDVDGMVSDLASHPAIYMESEQLVSCSEEYELEEGEILDSEEDENVDVEQEAHQDEALVDSCNNECDADDDPKLTGGSSSPKASSSRQEISSSSNLCSSVLGMEPHLVSSVSSDEDEEGGGDGVNSNVQSTDTASQSRITGTASHAIAGDVETVDSTSSSTNFYNKKHRWRHSFDSHYSSDVTSSTSLNNADSFSRHLSLPESVSDSSFSGQHDQAELSRASSSHATNSVDLESTSHEDGASTGVGAGPSSSVTSTSGSPHIPMLPTKKKVSLLEYRKRMKHKPEAKSPCSSGSGSGRSTPVQSHGPVPSNSRAVSSSKPTSSSHQKETVTLAPLPMFEKKRPDRRDADRTNFRGHSLSPLPCPGDRKDDQDVRWNSSATAAERILETKAPQLSLTERLRREFGLDASESEDEEERKDVSTNGIPPPPPPPLCIVDELPPPPPPPRLPSCSTSMPVHPRRTLLPTPGMQRPPAPAALSPHSIRPMLSPNLNAVQPQPPSNGIPPLLSVHCFPTKPFTQGMFEEESAKSSSGSSTTAPLQLPTTHTGKGSYGQTFGSNNPVPPPPAPPPVVQQQQAYNLPSTGQFAPSHLLTNTNASKPFPTAYTAQVSGSPMPPMVSQTAASVPQHFDMTNSVITIDYNHYTQGSNSYQQ